MNRRSIFKSLTACMAASALQVFGIKEAVGETIELVLQMKAKAVMLDGESVMLPPWFRNGYTYRWAARGYDKDDPLIPEFDSAKEAYDHMGFKMPDEIPLRQYP